MLICLTHVILCYLLSDLLVGVHHENSSSSSPSTAAAADDELEPLKYPLILDLELDTFVSSEVSVVAVVAELEPRKYPLLLDVVVEAIISSICVGSDKSVIKASKI